MRARSEGLHNAKMSRPDNSAVSVATGEPRLFLLGAKFEPPLPRELVPRDGLVQALGAGLVRPLTVMRGPAGSGKSLLMAQWRLAALSDRKVAWLSLDEGDNEPVRFWSYVIAALRSVLPEFGEGPLSLLRAPGVDLMDEAVPALINELLETPSETVLLLDDYHVIQHEAIHAGMGFLLEHMPGNHRFVIASRSEPPLPLARLRARGSLSEIDPEQLGFSQPEAEYLLNEVHQLGLAVETVSRLHQRTEGWAAGLYLAALSLRDRRDADELIAGFSGGDRRIVDYLAGEVLDQQPDAVLSFLLRTSVLERFSAQLCDAVTGAGDAREMLDRVERSNYFLIPLDPRREWYRYHHLFAELLRHELERRDPGASAELSRRAGRWLADAGMISEAIPHMVAAGELDQAADLIASHGAALATGGRALTVAEWFDALPTEYVVADARLCVGRAGLGLALGRHDEILPWLDRAERAPNHRLEREPTFALRATVRRAAAWRLLGDVRLSSELAEQVIPLDGSSRDHALAADVLGATARWLGDDAAAVGFFTQAGQLGRELDPATAAAAYGQLALIASDHNDWRTCDVNVETAFVLIGESGLQEYWMGSFAHLAKGRLLVKQRKPSDAQTEFTRAITLARRGVGVVEMAYVLITVAEARRELGDRRSAVELVREARELSANAADPGTVVPRLLDRAEGSLRLVSERRGSRLVAFEELTAREAAVLALLPTGLSAREIGQELGVSRNTVKTHSKNLYRKLGATGRREAVARGRELGLL
jgi:LuxR family maltose regulon positive regulatory protein